MQPDVVANYCYTCVTGDRNLPLSIVISISAIIVLYVFANFAYFVVIGIDGVLQSEAVAVVRFTSLSRMRIGLTLQWAQKSQ